MGRDRRGVPPHRPPGMVANWSRPGRGRRGRTRRRLGLWFRERRVGLWLAVLLGLVGLAYAVTRFIEATGRYGPSYYEPKDIERQRYQEQQGGAR